MKSLTKNMMLAIAALAMAAGTVSAQTMKAEIPFAFRVGKKVMQPGEYRVRVLPGYSTPVLTVANLDDGKSAIVLSTYRNDPSKAWAEAGLAKLSFECGEGPCSLKRMWTGAGSAYNFHSEPAKNGDLRTAEITLRTERAD